MLGQMMNRPLLISSFIDYAADSFPDRPIVSRTVEGGTHRYNYLEARARAAQLAHALQALGVQKGDRVATLAWNSYRHLELYYSVAGMGAVCHTINPRLHEDQLDYVVNHAEDRFLFVDLTFLPLVEKLADRFPTIEKIIVMTDEAHMPESSLEGLLCYETLLDGQPEDIVWPEFDENLASGLCYTSGTTGNPKGVLYSHRSTVLHALCAVAFPGIDSATEGVMLSVVPLFHASAWGLPYIAALTGMALVLPGPNLDGASLFDLMDEEGVTQSWGVPTIWLWLLAEMEKRGRKPKALRTTVVGGSAATQSLIDAFEKKYDITVNQGWGMTEMSPIGTISNLRYNMTDWDHDQVIARKVKQGHRMFQVDLRVVDDEGRVLPNDGEARGELQVRGPAIAGAYFRDDEATKAAFTEDGWFGTGDVSTIAPDGCMEIVDRTKDLIKSGGEWISSIDLEGAAMGHPDVAAAAAIGLPHEKWVERPFLVVVRQEGSSLDRQGMLEYLSGEVAKWWLPDDVVFVDALPLTATGKVSKLTLRDAFKDHLLPGQ